MNRLLLLVIVLCVSITGVAQNQKSAEDKVKEKEIRKKIQATQDSITYETALLALKNQNFVMKADQLIFKRGRSTYVNSITNFVSLKDDKAIVQIAPFNAMPGFNGVGGITVDGLASNIKMKTDKKGRTYFSMNVTGTGISATVDIVLSPGSNNASVTVNPNFNSNRVTLNGILIPASESNVFQGTTR